MYDDWPRQMRRRLRKLLGFPASHDVGILSRLLDPLREQVEERLGRKVSSAIVTFPNLVALYDEDIVDAMDYAGLTPLHTKFGGVGSQPHEASTAYAGYGLGLCSNYTDWNQCDEEEKQRPLQQVLTILYTKTAFVLYRDMLRGAYQYYEPENGSSNFNLRSNSTHDNPADEYYWETMREQILCLMFKSAYGIKVSQVILLGESALGTKFLRFIKSTLLEVQEELPEFFMSDPVYAAAKGAAEFSIRSPYYFQPPPPSSTRAGDFAWEQHQLGR